MFNQCLKVTIRNNMSYLSPLLKLENLQVMMPEDDTEPKRYATRTVSAEWRVPIHGKLHKVEFEHGTTTGRRMVWLDGKEIIRKDFMFKLVGDAFFNIEDVPCRIRIEPVPNFKYFYELYADGKTIEQYTQKQAKALKTWFATIKEKDYRIVLEKDTMNIYLNGELREEIGEFVDNGTDTTFEFEQNQFILMARKNNQQTGAKKREGLTHLLKVNGVVVPESSINNCN